MEDSFITIPSISSDAYSIIVYPEPSCSIFIVEAVEF